MEEKPILIPEEVILYGLGGLMKPLIEPLIKPLWDLIDLMEPL